MLVKKKYGQKIKGEVILPKLIVSGETQHELN